jgi:hypothetical protein
MKELAFSIGNWTIQPPSGVPDGRPGMFGIIINTVINLLLVAAVLIGLLFLIWGGIDYITSEGQKEKISRARRKIMFALIGIIVAFLAFAAISFVQTLFGVNLLGKV